MTATKPTPLTTPTPSYQLGDRVLDGGAGPYEIDGLRLEVAKYTEEWTGDGDDATATLHAVQPGWQYHLVSRRLNSGGNEQVRPWGWVGERDLFGVE